MTIIDANTVVVMTSSELKTVLEGVNTYTTIYFGANITLAAGITINASKTNLIIDGTYNGVRYRYTDMRSTATGDTIAILSAVNANIVVRNMDITGYNYYGVIYVAEDTSLRNVVVEYNNVVYVGPQMTFHPTGLTRYVDTTITIQANYSPANEVAECNRIEIGGKTTINTTSSSTSMFWFRGDSTTAYFHILESANVNITSPSRELLYGYDNLAFSVLKNSTFNLTTYYGMSYATFGTGATLIDTNATLKLTQTGVFASYPTWYIGGAFTMNENSSLIFINSNGVINTITYNLYFRGSASININNPKAFVLYNRVTDVIYTSVTVPVTLKYSRLNIWNTAADISIAGSLSNLPTYSWYKTDASISQVVASMSTTTMSVTTNNYTAAELAVLPAITNLNFLKKRAISMGVTALNIDILTDEDLQITGLTAPNASILVTYNTTSVTVTADSSGNFVVPLTTPLAIGTNVTFLSNVAKSFIYTLKNKVVVDEGEIVMTNVPTQVTFRLVPFQTNPILCPRTEALNIAVTDTRARSKAWQVYVSMNRDLTSSQGKVLTNSVVYQGTTLMPVATTPILIYSGTANGGTTKVTNIVWAVNEGIVLRLLNQTLEANQEYTATLTWNLQSI